MEGTQATEPKFLDQRLHKKRKLAAGTKSSRTWFVKGSDWLAGTTADAQAAPAFFDEPEQVSYSSVYLTLLRVLLLATNPRLLCFACLEVKNSMMMP